MKERVIRNMDDLLEIFPRMTLPQIIVLYSQTIRTLDYLNTKLDGLADYSAEQNEVLDKISKFSDYDAFLSGFLARCFCCQNGFDI